MGIFYLRVGLYILMTLSPVFGGGSRNATIADFDRLINDTLTPYSPLLRPVTNQNEPIDIEITFTLLSLVAIDAIKQQMVLNAWFNVTWYDEIRAWDPKDYGGIFVLNPLPKDIWRPHAVVSNSLATKDVFGDERVPLSIWHDGMTMWFPGDTYTLSCDLDMTNFPFDEQTCILELLTLDGRHVVIMHFSDVGMYTAGFTTNGEWNLKEYETYDNQTHHDLDRFRSNTLTIKFVFKRRATIYVITILIPVMFISFLTFFSFIIPEDSGERCSFGITVLLALAVYMTIVTQQIPPTSDTFPIIIIFIFSLFLLSGCCVTAIVIKCRIMRATILEEQQQYDTLRKLEADDVAYATYKSKVNYETKNKKTTSPRALSMFTNFCSRWFRSPCGCVNPKQSSTKVKVIDISCKDNDIDNQLVDFKQKPTDPKPCYESESTELNDDFFKQGDVLLFIMFSFVWMILSTYFLIRMV